MSASLKRECGMLLIVSIILLSILALLPDADVDHDAGYTASELSIRETVDGSVISTSHVKPDGVITDAIDMGYATVCRMQDDDDRVVEERYLDANGYPVARYENFHGLSYEYDETSTVITYLDVEGNPIIRSDRYSTIVRTQVDGRAYDDFFYDLNGQQVQCSGGYYGLRRGYNAEGQDISLAFLDKDGHAVCTSSGYAIMTYQRDMNGNVVGKQYFDTDGNPKALSKGQYGIKRSGKANILLDRNGNVMPCVDNLLNGFPCMVVVLGCVVCLLMIALPKSLSVVRTVVYIAFILYETLMLRESGDARTNFVLFSYAGKFLKEQSVRVGDINNIWLLIPLGTGLYRWFQKKWVLLIPFVMSVAIETTQYITGLGIAEFDDVFGNTMGGWIGILVAYIIMMWRSEMVNRHLPRRPIL